MLLTLTWVGEEMHSSSVLSKPVSFLTMLVSGWCFSLMISLYTKPVIYNATFLGPGKDADGRDKALLMRENYAGTLANSVLADFPDKEWKFRT